MEIYTLPQWLLFFFIYCFLGWVWESCYVSAKKGKWINRGFLHGPFLPIYGSGVIVILLATIPVRTNIALIFIFGMVAATTLEYCTGYCMEKMFGVRYWDYSNHRFNLNGHICLFVSIGWGIGSVIIVRLLHLPIEHFVLMIPSVITEVAALALTVGVTIDFTQSFNEAMDLRAMLTKISESNEQIRMLEKRLEVAVAFGEDSYQRFRKATAEGTSQTKALYIDNVRKMKEIKDQKLQELEEMAKKYFAGHEKNAQDEKTFMDSFRQLRSRMGSQTEKEYTRLERILRRNPDAVSTNYKEALGEIKKLMINKKREGNNEQTD